MRRVAKSINASTRRSKVGRGRGRNTPCANKQKREGAYVRQNASPRRVLPFYHFNHFGDPARITIFAIFAPLTALYRAQTSRPANKRISARINQRINTWESAPSLNQSATQSAHRSMCLPSHDSIVESDCKSTNRRMRETTNESPVDLLGIRRRGIPTGARERQIGWIRTAN